MSNEDIVMVALAAIMLCLGTLAALAVRMQ